MPVGSRRVFGLDKPNVECGLKPLDHVAHQRSLVADDNDGLAAPAGFGMGQGVGNEREPCDLDKRLGEVALGAYQSRTKSSRQNHDLFGWRHQRIVLEGGQPPAKVGTLVKSTVVPTAGSGITFSQDHRRVTPLHTDQFDRDVVEIVRRLSRRAVEPAPESELLADLGFDSFRVLELVGELEDHFNIAVPLNALTHIRTVGQIADEVRRLAALRVAEGRAAQGATEGHPA